MRGAFELSEVLYTNESARSDSKAASDRELEIMIAGKRKARKSSRNVNDEVERSELIVKWERTCATES